jgi:hypothetical protein
MSNVLWIIGAGASHHLGMPLLNSFSAFFKDLWYGFKENREHQEFQETLPFAIETLDRHADKNIEVLLSSGSPLSPDEKNLLKRAIRRGFERRNLGRILKVFGKHGKLGPYSRLLGLIEEGDTVVSFNYDNALETPLCLESARFDALNSSELSGPEMDYLTDGRAKSRWIPSDSLSQLKERTLEYAPNGSFQPGTPTVIGGGRLRIPFIKIHGSVNWFQADNLIHVGSPIGGNKIPLIVYPEGDKPELMNEPYPAIVDAANDALARCDIIVIVGYSFPQSDASGHPFVSNVASAAVRKKMVAIDPFPKDELKRIVGEDRIMPITFEDAVQPRSSGQTPLGQELDSLKRS